MLELVIYGTKDIYYLTLALYAFYTIIKFILNAESCNFAKAMEAILLYGLKAVFVNGYYLKYALGFFYWIKAGKKGVMYVCAWNKPIIVIINRTRDLEDQKSFSTLFI